MKSESIPTAGVIKEANSGRHHFLPWSAGKEYLSGFPSNGMGRDSMHLGFERSLSCPFCHPHHRLEWIQSDSRRNLDSQRRELVEIEKSLSAQGLGG